MTNQIPARQNEAIQIERLAAQRQMYRQAKRIQAVQASLAVPFPIAWPLLVATQPLLAPYAALWGVVSSILDVTILSPAVKEAKKQAALIQETFDCDVLAIPWHDLHSGKKPLPEVVRRASGKFDAQGGDRRLLTDWYPRSVGQLSQPLGRIVCQRASCWWDGDLRRRYSGAVLALLVTVACASLAIGLSAGFTLERFVLAVATPLLPLVIFGIKQHGENAAAARSIDSLRGHAEGFWKQALQGRSADGLDADSRDLQCEIFTHRQTAPLIFDWIYYRLRSEQEDLMNIGSESLVREALESQGGFQPRP